MKGTAALVLVALLCGAAGFLAYQHFRQAPQVTVTAAPAAANPVPPAADAPAPKRTIPETVPDVRLQDVSGKLHALREYRGTPTIINFWATWCAPCRREIPLLNVLRHDYSGQKLQIVGIAVDFREAVAEFVKTTRLDYTLLVGEQDGVDAAASFGMELVLPFSIFVDSEQRIVAVKVGELHRDEADAILAAIQSLQAGHMSLPAARQKISAQLHQLSIDRALKNPQNG